jgi:hypothetical protein
MDEQSATTVIEGTRKCPECAYALEPFDTECPRCAMQRAQAAEGAAPAPAAPAPYTYPSPAVPAPTPTAAPWENTSGTPGALPPAGVPGWNWGAFLLTPFWAIAHQVWIGLLCFVPYVGWVMSIVLGVKGSEWAWQNRRFESVEHFHDVQRAWMLWAIGLNVAGAGLAFLIFLVVALSAGAGGTVSP